MSRVHFERQMLPRICKDYYELEIYHNPTGSATFDPGLTTPVSTTVIWQTEAGTTVTTGTSHALSYTPTAGPKVCKVTVLAGLRAVTGLDCDGDAIARIRGLNRLVSCTNVVIRNNASLVVGLADLPPGGITVSGYANPETYGDLSQIPATYATISLVDCAKITGALASIQQKSYIYLALSNITGITGSLSDAPATVTALQLSGCTGISPASIAHLVAIRDLRIYNMGWTAQQNTDVLLSAWSARANYTYASGIVLRIGAPTGTPGTEPPAEGESNADWSWNAGTSRHDPLTGYAAIADLQADYYDEGFKGWTVTIL